jgi:DNA-directed RNA polymerase subunit beta
MESNAEILDAFKDMDDDIIANHIAPTLEKDKTTNKIEALNTLYKLLRPGDLATDERVEELFDVTFFNRKRFELGEIARMKMESKLGIKKDEKDENKHFLALDDFITAFKYYLNFHARKEGFEPDDIDHLSNRRVRSV